jgi:hypothetical protein
MPPASNSTSIDEAEIALLYGYTAQQIGSSERNPAYRRNYRWRNNPATFLLNDFEQLLVYLFSDENDTSVKYRRSAKETGRGGAPPETKLDIIQRIWEETLLHRKLEISGGKVETSATTEPSTIYNAAEMSDGERVIFYLIGQALSAPDGGIIVIDEPELHLHRSIQATLWDKIEAARPDCIFVYLTHDLDFAASRVAATKICLRSFDGEAWDWFVVPENEELPEEIYLEILGSRKPILFVEGDKGKWDYFLFQKVYPEFTIAPCGGAEGVIHATRSFSSLAYLHRHTCYGIIDRDFRDDDQVQWLRDRDVYVLNYSEIENLLLSEAVLYRVAAHIHLEHDEFASRFERVKDIVFAHMAHNKERLVSSITASKIERLLKNFDAKAEGKADLKTALNAVTSVNVDTLYNTTLVDINAIISSRNYSQALQTYNDKGLVFEVSSVFGFKPSELAELVKRRVSSGKGDDLIEALRRQTPAIPTQ